MVFLQLVSAGPRKLGRRNWGRWEQQHDDPLPCGKRVVLVLLFQMKLNSRDRPGNGRAVVRPDGLAGQQHKAVYPNLPQPKFI